MEPWVIALAIKPLALLLFLGFVHLLSKDIISVMPECKLKRILLISWKV